MTRHEQREATHEKVLSAAAELFLSNGFKATTVREIASAAGVSVGTVMAVGDKAALLVGIFDEKIASIHATRDLPRRSLAESPVDCERPDGSSEEILQLVEPFLVIFARQSALAREYGSVLMSGNHHSAIFEGLATTLRQEIETILRRSGVTSYDPSAAAATIHLAYLGTIFAWAGSGELDPAKPLRDLRNVLTFVLEKKRH